MADLPNTTKPQAQTPEEMRQEMLAQLDASEERVGELSDEELKTISGGGAGITLLMTSLMGGGGALGGTGIGSTASNTHMNAVTNNNASAASSANGNINITSKIRR